MQDIAFKIVRAGLLSGIVLFLWHVGGKSFRRDGAGWYAVLGGFGLLLFASLLDIAADVDALGRFALFRPSWTQAFLEKGVGVLGGFLVLAMGLVRWVPGVRRRLEQGTADPGQAAAALAEQTCAREGLERELRETKERFRVIAEATPLAIGIARLSDGVVLCCNRAMSMLLGVASDEIVGTTADRLYENPDDARKLAELVGKEGFVANREVRLKRADGAPAVGLAFVHPVELAGEPALLTAILDITERKEREDQLRRAHKGEALAKLTSGVAHEFNNLLFAVTGTLELLEDQVAGNDKAARLVRLTLDTAFRGGELTQQLISYVGQQTLKPRVVDLDSFVSSKAQVLRPGLGETVEIELTGEGGLWPVSVDMGQLENALVNLAINARDAMPDGGTITIETANVHLDATRAATFPDKAIPGDYVALAVRDEGAGMPADVMRRATDPFFTTKGAAAGLGLSMVYGFVRQSGGSMAIESEEGSGTTVTLYLPRVGAKEAASPTPPRRQGKARRGSATVLIVEDDPLVRRVAVEALQRLGYRTVSARNGPDALDQLTSLEHIDLLLTDVVLPGGLGGARLARAVTGERPDTKVVFVTGYSDSEIAAEGVCPDSAHVLYKPFSIGALAEMVADVLKPGDGG